MTEERAPYGEHKELPDDEGPTYIGVGIKDQHVMIEFTKPIKWLGMHAGDARRFAASLVKYADVVEREAMLKAKQEELEAMLKAKNELGQGEANV